MKLDDIPAFAADAKAFAARVHAEEEAFAVHMGTTVEALRSTPEDGRTAINAAWAKWKQP